MINQYTGGKNGAGTYQQIINHIPKHKVYIEGFLGSGAILKNKLAADTSICYDRDRAIIKTWSESKQPGCTFISDDTIRLLKTSWPLINLIHNSGTAVFIYLDPPYPFRSRKSKNDLYNYEMMDLQHKQMLTHCLKLNCYVMISSYKNNLYDQILKGWNTHQFESQTRNGKATECIYFNYDPPTILHDYRYLGNDFREREKIKGSRKRIISKFKRMPATIRNDILTELIEMIPGK